MADSNPNQPASQSPSPADASAATNSNDPATTPIAPEAGAGPPPAQPAGEPGAASETNGPAPALPAEPLSDGTRPTILAPGETPKTNVRRGKVTLTTVYRRADITTTLLTFGGAIVAAGLIVGAYVFLTAPKPSNTPKPANLSQSDLDKISAFFGGNSAGSSSDILNINASSFFKNRVAIASDLKITGGTEISGPTVLGDLTVDKTSTLGITNVRGQLTVTGPLTANSPAVLNNGASITGNLAVSGNGSFGGSLSAGTINAATLAVTSAFNLSAHINTSGSSPTMTGGSISGNDTSGSFTISGGSATITFHSAYTKTPHVLLTPNAVCPGSGQFFVQETGGTGFVVSNPANCTSFNYWVVQ